MKYKNSIISFAFCLAVAFIFYNILRNSGPNAPLHLILDGDIEAGILKTSAYAMFFAAIQLFILWRSPRLGYYGLVAVAATLAGIFIVWFAISGLIGDSSVYVLALSILVLGALIAGATRKGAHKSVIGPIGTTVALVFSIPVLTMCLIALYFLLSDSVA